MNNSVYMNRELSWLKFNERVLEEAESRNVPLCERLSFASIYQTNLDEFFMVRVGSLVDQMMLSKDLRDNKTKMTAKEQIMAILSQVTKLNRRKDAVYAELMEEIEKQGIKLVNFQKIGRKGSEYLERYFDSEIAPLISPTVVGKRQPFPFIRNREIYAVVVLQRKNGKEKLGLIPCGSGVFPRLIEVPGQEGTYMLSEELILHFIPKVFPGYFVKAKSLIRVTRNADIDADALYDEDLDYREFMVKVIKKRKRLAPVRLELSRELDGDIVDVLCEYLEVSKKYVFRGESPLDLSFVFQIQDMLRHVPELFYEKRVPQKSPQFRSGVPILQQIEEGDKLLSYPFESIRPFLDMLREAANDDSVVSIKMTLYRVARQSKVVEALIEAAENGKEVLVLVELKARFDEENNIIWARRLEQAGCHVIYGLVGLKTHAKIILIVRKEADGIKRYVHLGTGNYNDNTAKLYTDMGLLTANDQFGSDASAFFNLLSGYSQPPLWNKLVMAPLGLRDKIYELIDNEIAQVKAGNKGHIIVKMNSLIDQQVIQKLYEASIGGVQVELIVRGICGLRAGVEGISENITVRSIVGRQLEHSRIFWFANGGEQQLYLSSADWMPRNLNDRVELFFPVESEEHIKRIKEILDLYLRDNVGAHMMQSNGTYRRVTNKATPVSAQSSLYEEALLAAAADKIPMEVRLRPMYSKDSKE